MENNNNSYGASWADQWDYNNPDPVPVQNEKKSSSGTGGGAAAKYGKKVGDKTKAVASTGLKKVKEGTTLGFHWIKDKYNKRTQKN
ncbi:hypothetical protein AQUCO_00200331v1 [Aquilegia coerulea]|uniref:CDP-diacylglycerol-glycerol-3-phosphate 3-phosphatidyltransferase n=1 Tax=Aquilegia coerulea TaxID=218851 RepID=A0A2G5F2M5_AQUCA|nr:hypothetical protein AQUCO_00200331v1 [Aquilegia coerulea]